MKTLIVVSLVAVAGAAFGEFKKPPEPKDVPELMVSSSGERILRPISITQPLRKVVARKRKSPRGIGALRSMADGEHYCTMNAIGIAKYSYATGEKVEDVCLFGGPGNRNAKKAKPMPRMESYAFSADEQKILLSSGFEPLYRHSGVSDYYIYDVQAKTFTKISNNGKQRLTTLSPDGTKVAFVRDNNLYWMDLATLEEHAITTDGKVNEIINGTNEGDRIVTEGQVRLKDGVSVTVK